MRNQVHGSGRAAMAGHDRRTRIGTEAYAEFQTSSGRLAIPVGGILPSRQVAGETMMASIRRRTGLSRGPWLRRLPPELLAQQRRRGGYSPQPNPPGFQGKPALPGLPQQGRRRPALRPGHHTHLSQPPRLSRWIRPCPSPIPRPPRRSLPPTAFTTMRPSPPEERTPAFCGTTARCCARGRSTARPPSRLPSPRWSPSHRVPTTPAG